MPSSGFVTVLQLKGTVGSSLTKLPKNEEGDWDTRYRHYTVLCFYVVLRALYNLQYQVNISTPE
jgi:hypothetical protein